MDFEMHAIGEMARMDMNDHLDGSEIGVGQGVMYIGPDGNERGAMVIGKYGTGDIVNLLVFIDGTNDRLYGRKMVDPLSNPMGVFNPEPNFLHWATSVHYAKPDQKKPNTWHY
jgi:hypothetical protein